MSAMQIISTTEDKKKNLWFNIQFSKNRITIEQQSLREIMNLKNLSLC